MEKRPAVKISLERRESTPIRRLSEASSIASDASRPLHQKRFVFYVRNTYLIIIHSGTKTWTNATSLGRGFVKGPLQFLEQPKEVYFQQMHNQDLRQWFLTVSWDFRAKPNTPGSVLAFL